MAEMLDPSGSEYAVVCHAANPFDEGASGQTYWLMANGRSGSDLTLIPGWPNVVVVTWDGSRLAKLLSASRVSLPTVLVDVWEAERLLCGHPVKSKAGRYLKSFWTTLQRRGVQREEALRMRRWAMLASLAVERTRRDKQTAKDLALELQRIWKQQCNELAEQGEARRFWEVEVPCTRLLAESSQRGIPVSDSEARALLDELDKRIASRLRRLLLDEKVNPEDDKSVRDWLIRAGQTAMVLFCGTSSELTDTLKVVAAQNVVAEDIRQHRLDIRQRRSILRLGVIGEERVHPSFKCMGTVTARIIARDPHLQFIRRSSRRVLRAEPFKDFIYPDFVNFEPAILADDSQDPTLLDDVNRGTLYTECASTLFSDASQRSAAKLLFIAYCNGSSLTTLGQIVANALGIPETLGLRRVATFFSRYQVLQEWRTRIINLLRMEGRVGSRLGNYRHRERRGRRVSSDECRWAVNQRIQGTASLILKRAMIGIDRADSSVEMLLPMHDAVLYQVPAAKSGICTNTVAHVFEQALAEECPRVIPRVSVASFAPTLSD